MLIKAQAGGPNATYRVDNGGGGRVTVVILKPVTCTSHVLTCMRDKLPGR